MTTEHAQEPQEKTGPTRSGQTRRRFLAGAGGAAGALALWPAGSARAAVGSRVAVLGGGVSGLSAAHELAERGYAVTVYEYYDALGGKARSMPVPGTATGGRADLPAEHGFRFSPASTGTCRTPCAASRSPATRVASTTTSSAAPRPCSPAPAAAPTCTSHSVVSPPRPAPATSPSAGSATSSSRCWTSAPASPPTRPPTSPTASSST